MLPCPCQRDSVTVPDGTPHRDRPAVVPQRALSPPHRRCSLVALIAYISDMRLPIPVMVPTAYV